MGLIERIVACGSCGYTGTTHPGRHSPEPLASSCYVCETGTMVEFVNPAIVRGAVAEEQLAGGVDALHEAIRLARDFNRGAMTWQEYDRKLATLEVAHPAGGR